VEQELTLTRIFNAPRELVFNAWINPNHLSQWWGPKDFTNPVCELDLRPGGAILIHMTAPDGTMMPNKGIFHEIIEPERLVFTTSAFEDDQGIPQLEVLNTVIFAQHEINKTKLTLHAVVLKATPEMEGSLSGMNQGWNESLDRLIDSLSIA
jgi:uncharacterized protein YndB with AHSA1/START domain